MDKRFTEIHSFPLLRPKTRKDYFNICVDSCVLPAVTEMMEFRDEGKVSPWNRSQSIANSISDGDHDSDNAESPVEVAELQLIQTLPFSLCPSVAAANGIHTVIWRSMQSL